MTNSVVDVLELKHLRMRYPSSSNWILEDLNLKVLPGDRLALVGPSGSGKSTIARIALQLLPVGSCCEGQILINGQDPRKINSNKLRRLRGEEIGLVFQDPMSRLNPLMSVGEHLIDTLRAHSPGRDLKDYRNRSKDLLLKVGISPSRFNSYPHEFSGGMRQRVIIALAISLNPSLIIADEPTTSLDSEVASQVMGVLKSLCDELGVSLLLITHDLGMAFNWCEQIAILDQGKIVEKGSSRSILDSPQSEVAKRLVSAAREREQRRCLISSQDESLVLEVKGLKCWHSLSRSIFRQNWLKAVDGISFSLRERESLGVVGISGCGKSTLCRALMGLLPVKGGEVNLLGQDFRKNRNNLKLKRSIQMVFQDPLASLNPKMRIWEIIADPLLIHHICSKAEAKEKARILLTQVGLNPPEKYQYRFPRELSGGQQQRVSIARSIALQPRILICDESLSMLDPEIQVDILKLIKELQYRLKLALLLITHDLNIATGFCDNVIVLDKGKIVERGSGKELLENPKELITRKLFSASPKLPDNT